ncbi:MAG: metallopeptidase family protein [Oscillochloridaceae bacterium umkhey_bin13]
MDSSRFEQIVIAALEDLPLAFASYLANVEILVQRRPSREQRRELGLKPWQGVYGMYEGVPYPERSHDMIVAPDTIIIFQDPLVRDFGTGATLRSEVRRTVMHEIAHLFGISDERLRELDAY